MNASGKEGFVERNAVVAIAIIYSKIKISSKMPVYQGKDVQSIQ